MLNNTVYLAKSSTDGENIAVALIDGPTNQKTLRSSSDGRTQLSIGHQSSNENPGFVTQRSNVRISRSFEIEDTGKSVDAYAQLTLSVPRDEVTAAQLGELVCLLVNMLLTPNLAVDEDGQINGQASLPLVARLYAGEP
jgi:hypothetical protein